MKTIQFSLTHNGREWVASNRAITLSAPELEDLDAKVRKTLTEQGLVSSGEKAKVWMAFDMSTIPQWIRQYSQHYFNRVIWVNG
ncbi:hypothetical protein SAMN02746041_00958 [Desulfacinum hydrothermale DSM 13146]|uniref:Uncharacterized protein n=1 Tax=Desulfacinum hydrothermale DSM 13146 TaxID=1121390 RepID=A0A1W1XA93_9BACT|nr:DUF5395 family protein [Desulfacinum hydrothermale]SMC20588.1 hypothetical protein SAMN02746041_00958 [Desulfacinum hydrothermale DSM 13146]